MSALNEFFKNGQTTISNLILNNYRQLGMTNEEFLLWLQLYSFHEKGEDFPDFKKIAEIMGYEEKDVYKLLNQLLQKKIITMSSKKDSAGKKSDFYEFTGIFERLELFMKQEKQQKTVINHEEKVRQLYQMFESEFGRPLSAIEYQRIGQWIQEDKYDPDLIQFALREAVLNQAYSLNYIDRILLSWERKNITSKQQVLEEQKRRKQQLLQKEGIPKNEGKLPNIPMHNWLEGE